MDYLNRTSKIRALISSILNDENYMDSLVLVNGNLPSAQRALCFEGKDDSS